MEQQQRVTELLQGWRSGDTKALDDLLPLVYKELRRLARGQLRRERPDHTLQSAALSEYIAKFHSDGAYQVAEVCAFRGEPDKAFEWLDRAYSQRDPGVADVKVDPLLKNLKSDPRYAAFLKKMRLPE